jgi:hypothetical protein
MVLLCLFGGFTPLEPAGGPFVIKTAFDDFTADNIGNVYFLKEAELQKFQANGKLFARYSNLQLGDITLVDVTNPLKILLYYRDLQQLVFLDNQLSGNSAQVSLVDLGYEQTDLVCSSVNNSFWLYNKQNNELLRFNESSQKVANTGNLKQLLRNNINPVSMLEHNNYLYLNCPDNGIYVFDMFGAFVKLIGITKLKEFQVNDKLIYFQRDSLLCSYHTKLLEELCKPLPNIGNKRPVKYLHGKLYQAFKDSLVIQPF